MTLFPPNSYLYVYLFVATVSTILVATSYYFIDGERIKVYSPRTDYIALFIALFFAIFIGAREPIMEYFGDSEGMARYFNLIKLSTSGFKWDREASNFIFDNLLEWMSKSGYTYTAFFTVISVLYFFGALLVCKLMFPNHLLASYLVWLSGFMTYGSSVNGFKAGVASIMFLLALAFKERQLILSVLFLILSLGFHHAMNLCVASFVLAFLIRSTRVYVAFWIVCVIISAAHITYFQELLVDYVDEKGAAYLIISDDPFREGYYTGFRIDFILFSIMPIILGLYAIAKKQIEDKNFKFWLNVYLISNGLWLLCMYASYANRIAALSWAMYPILLCYPFLRCNWGNNRYATFTKVILVQLGFNLFMKLIYVT